MNIFNQLKNPKKSVDNKEVIVNDFQRRIPYWSYRATNYGVYEPFIKFKDEIDGYLAKLFSGEIDDGNGDVLDNMIFDMARQAEKSLAEQRTEHRDIIKSFDIRMKSDRDAFERELELLRTQLEDNMKKQERYSSLVENDEFLQDRRAKQ